MHPRWSERRVVHQPLDAVQPSASCFRRRQLHASSMERAAMRFTRRLYSRLSAVNRRAASAFAGLCSASTGQIWHYTARQSAATTNALHRHIQIQELVRQPTMPRWCACRCRKHEGTRVCVLAAVLLHDHRAREATHAAVGVGQQALHAGQQRGHALHWAPLVLDQVQAQRAVLRRRRGRV